MKKISSNPEGLVENFMNNLKNDKRETYIVQTRLLKVVSLISLTLADKILKNG
jgi:hypothetical protein